MKKLSVRQEKILNLIQEFLEEQGYPPTVRDIQYACDISSTSVVDYNLKILQKEGYIRRSPEISRGIEVLGGKRHKDALSVPVMGYIAAGEPIPVPTSEGWAPDSAVDQVDVVNGMMGGVRVRGTSNLYALRVRGTSMIDALVDDGDVVVIQPADSVKDGDMVVAWLKNEKEATLKRIYNDGTVVRLQPANSQMEPIFVSASNIEVQGKVVAVLRNLG